MKNFHFLLIPIFLYALPSTANQLNVNWGIAHNQFQYQEFDENNNRLLTEDGSLPKLNFSLRYENQGSYFSTGVSYSKGRVNYDGQTQSRQALTTITDSELSLFYGEFGWRVYRQTELFIKISQHYWNRDIQPTSTSEGLFERYYWHQLGVGARYLFKINALTSISSHMVLSHVQNPKVDVDLRPFGGENVTLAMDSAAAVETGIYLVRNFSPCLLLGIGATYYQYEFGASDSVRTRLGSRIVNISEPHSKTQQFDVGVFIQLTL